MRRVHVNGLHHADGLLHAARRSPAAASSPTRSSTAPSINGSQQQWLTRNSALDGWSNGVWNQVFSGDTGAPAQCFPAAPTGGGPYTTLADHPGHREKPYLYVDAAGSTASSCPRCAARLGRRRPGRPARPPARRSRSSDVLRRQAVATRVRTINSALAAGKNLLLTPGVYDVDRTIEVKRADTVVLGLGLRRPSSRSNGDVAMTRADVPGRRPRRADLRRGPDELAGAAAGRQRPTRRSNEQRGRPDRAAGRVLPHRRRRTSARPPPASSSTATT